ncbi:condensation domain-containing protein [Streptomyces sp. NBC_01538]|uniref:condensation domain-containing protein n=1 Tax=Streptomyces sp. NBC_01538 TaxID=2903897 RepID=UPI003865C66B
MSHRLPLLASQREVWLGQQIDPGSSVYNLGFYVPLSGKALRPALEGALRKALSETDALHVSFAEETGTPYQVIDWPTAWSVREIDTSGEADPEAEALAWMRADAATPIDLSRFPTFASALIRTGQDSYWWYQRFHHITLDATACMGFAARVIELLERPDAPVMSADDISDASITLLLDAEDDYRASADFTADENYWKAHAAGGYPRTGLGSAPPAPPAQFPLRHSVQLSPQVRASLIDVCDKAGVLWPTIAFGAVAAYLHLYSGMTDITLSVPVRARTDARTNTVPGMTVNILPLRLTVHGGMTLHSLIPRVTAELDSLLLHQRFRGEDLRRHIRGRNGDARLFGPTVNAITADAGDSTPTFICGGPVEEFQFQFMGGLDCQQLGIELLANPAIYSPDVLDSHGNQFHAVLEQLLEQPDGRLARAAGLVSADPQSDLGFGSSSRLGGTAESDVLSKAPDDVDGPELRVSRASITERLSGIWQHILETDDVGVDDHFFDLGGHSLLAMDVISAMETEFQVRISVHQFFNHPTVRELVDLVLDAAEDGAPDGADGSILDAVADLSDAEAAELLTRLRSDGSASGEVRT